MEFYPALLTISLFVSAVVNLYLFLKNKSLKEDIETNFVDISALKKDLERLKNLPKTEVRTVEAQQILHDMTAYGASIVKITPISPSEVFWRHPT
jgi:hypothetical protein